MTICTTTKAATDALATNPTLVTDQLQTNGAFQRITGN